jgi:hypothetical protein
MEDTTPEQKRMERSAFDRMVEACKVFNTIMTGPTPLTQDEIKHLIAKRPEVWGQFRAWVKS